MLALARQTREWFTGDGTVPHTAVPPKSLDAALAHVRSGGRLAVPTYTRCTIIDAKTLAKFERAGVTLLREEGDGYRMASGRSSVYLLPGQMVYA